MLEDRRWGSGEVFRAFVVNQFGRKKAQDAQKDFLRSLLSSLRYSVAPWRRGVKHSNAVRDEVILAHV